MPDTAEPNTTSRDNIPQSSPESAAIGEACPRHVRRALTYLRQHVAESVTLTDLAAVAGVSERTLRRNFTRFIGRSPLAYLRQLRLIAVRNDLLGGEGAVSQIAARHGFSHFGRFASAYRNCFGETPSATSRAQRDFQAFATGRSAARALEPSLIISTSSVGRGGREINQFIDYLGEQLAASLAGMSFITVRLVPSTHDLTAFDRRAARYVLTANVIAESGLLRVVVRLVATRDGHHLWGETFDGIPADTLGFQTRIVASAMGATRLAVMTAEIEAARGRPAEATSERDLVLKALPLAMSPDQNRAALATLYRTMELYPNSGLAAALAAWCHAQLVTPWNETGGHDKSRALTLAERAGVLDPTDSLVLTARAAVMTMTQDFGTADMLVQQALARDPKCSWAWERRGWIKIMVRHSDAIGDFEQALRLVGPESDGASSLFGIGTAHWCQKNYDASMVWVDRAAKRRPNAPGIQAQLAGCHIALGDNTGGRAILSSIMRSRPEITAGHIAARFWFDKPCPSVADVLSQVGLTQ